MNPVELGQGTFPLSEAATDRFAVMINIGYLPPDEEEKLVNFDFKRVRLRPLLSKQRIIELRARDQRARSFCTSASADTSSAWWPRPGPTMPTPTGGSTRRRTWSNAAWTSARRRARSSAGAGWPRCGRCCERGRAEVYPEDIQELAPYVLGHRIWLGPHAASHGLTTERSSATSSSRCRSHEARARQTASLVDLDEITEIELLIAARLRGAHLGEHRSRSDGTGFDFVGLRDWQSGDRWRPSTGRNRALTNFAPLVVREFDQPSTADGGGGCRPVAVDAVRRRPRRAAASAAPIVAARACAGVIGLSAFFFQDPFGLITFERDFSHLAGIAHARAATTSSTASMPTRRDAGSSR